MSTGMNAGNVVLKGCLFLAVALAVGAEQRPAGQAPARGAAPPRPDNAQSLAHLEAARKLAGTELTAPFNFFCVPANLRANSATAPELVPVKVFDNLFAAGNSETVVYAITTSDGIILIDGGYGDRVETVLVAGLRALGLDPAKVRYVLVTHGHGDHFGGSAYFQERYSARVGMSAADWDVVRPANPPAQANPNAVRPPRRDLVLEEGKPITLGDVSVTPVLIPGHTPGSMAFIFPVRDGKTVHVAGLFGGAMLTLERVMTPGLRQYVGTIDHYAEIARRMNVDVEIQNHPIFDDMSSRLARLKGRRSGEAHPFVIGAGAYGRFWNVVSECIQAEIARRGDG
jgi:metallo-beta-lactamase class B